MPRKRAFHPSITAVCATPSFWKDFGRDCVRIRFVADVFRPPTLSAGISDICEKRLNTELMPPPPKNWLIGENGEIKSDKEPMSPRGNDYFVDILGNQ